MNKYNNTKVEVDGIKFDSQKEARRYRDLKLMERAVKYIADFVYTEDGKQVVEDVKGYRTDVYKLKKRMMAEQLGIEISGV